MGALVFIYSVCADLLNLTIPPKIVADQLGHTLDVNQNIYTQASMELKMEAVNELEAVLVFQ